MRRLLIIIALIILVVGGASYFLLKQNSEAQYDGPDEELTVAVSRLEATTLVRIAESEGFFEDWGLDVTFVEDDLGKFSLQRVLNDEADIATAAEFPFVAQSFQRDDLRLFGTIHESNKNVRLLIRKDSGAVHISELSGQTIATTKGTVGEFFLELLLLSHGVNPKDVLIVDMTPEQIEQTILSGDIDGFALREPHVYRLAKQMEGDTIVFPVDPVDEVYTATFNLVAKADVIEKKRSAFERFLAALVDAEEYVQKHPQDAQETIAAELDLDRVYLEETWEDSSFRLQLTQALLVSMEDEARWRIEQGLVGADEIPDLLSLLETTLMLTVKPAAMQVIGAN